MKYRRVGTIVRNYFYQLPKASVITVGFVLLAVVGSIDYLTGPNFSLSVFYLIPVLFVSWYSERLIGIIMSFAAALVWFATALTMKKYYEHSVVLYWDDFMELVFFLVVTLLISALRSSLQREKEMASIDYLTKVPNRRYFHEFAEMELHRSIRYKHPLSVIYLDIDNFKTVNDTMGHSAGNTLLRLVADTFTNNIRSTDIVARLGGDEFALLLPESGPESAINAIYKALHSLKECMKNDWPVTFSIGMVTFLHPPATVDAMLRRADDLMYSVKASGKGAIRHEVVGDEPGVSSFYYELW